MGNAARTKIGADFEAAQRLADVGNKMPQWKAVQTNVTNFKPTGALSWFGTRSKPDVSWSGRTAWLAQHAQRVNNLQTALAAAVQQGVVTQDPQTGVFTPAVRSPRFLTGDRTSMAGAMTPNRTTTATQPPPGQTETGGETGSGTVYGDKTGTQWRYRGTAAEPLQDTDPNNWEQVTDNEQ